MMRTREFQWSWQGQNLVLGVDEAGDHRGGHADSQRKRCDADYNGSAHATSPHSRPSHPTSLNGDQSFSFPVFDTGSISARGKRSTAGPAFRRFRSRDASALINPVFYLIIAWFAEHFIAFAFFDILFPFFIWDAEHFRPKFTALGTHIWIHDKWDTAFIV